MQWSQLTSEAGTLELLHKMLLPSNSLQDTKLLMKAVSGVAHVANIMKMLAADNVESQTG